MGRYIENSEWGAKNLVDFVKAVRQSMGAAAACVRYDSAQDLTSAQKQTARANIGAAGLSAPVFSDGITVSEGAVISGGLTLSGGMLMANGGITTPSASQGLAFYNGNAASNGAGLWLYGNDHASAGVARLQVYNSSNNAYYQLNANPANGVLAWNGGVISATTFSGTATSATSANSATNAGNASSLGGLTSAGYVQTGNVNQTISGSKTFAGQLNCTYGTVSCCSTSANAQVYVDNGMGHKVGLHTNTANQAGIYDWSKSKWLIQCNSGGDVWVNGYAGQVRKTAATGYFVSETMVGQGAVSLDHTTFGAVFNAPTDSHRIALATRPNTNDEVELYSVTNANVSAGTNTVDKALWWNAGTGRLQADHLYAVTNTMGAVSTPGIHVEGTSTNYAINIRNTSVTKGTVPSGNHYWGINFFGNAWDNYNKRIGLVECGATSAGRYYVCLKAYACNTATNTGGCELSVNTDSAGNSYTAAPTPAAGDSSTKIATTAFVRGATVTSATYWGSEQNDISTNNTSATWVLVDQAGKCQHMLRSNMVVGKATQWELQSKSGGNLNDVKTAGLYYVSGTPTNIPSGVNGWVIVLESGAGLTRQIFFRGGTVNSNEGWWYSREVNTSTNEWGAWHRFLTDRSNAGPAITNTWSLGTSNYRWSQCYINATSVSTSDERLKNFIEAIPDEILDAWDCIEWKQFKFTDSIKEKGAEKARLHTGLIAQDIEKIFINKNLDIRKYGLFCYDEWEETEDSGSEAGENIFSLRYAETLCMEAAYQRRRVERAEARIASLEQRMDELEAVLAS